MIVAFLFVGYQHWGKVPSEALTCIYDKDACSLTVATWALVGVTILVFAAAVCAAIFAAGALKTETEKTLGQSLCVESDHRKSPDYTIYITAQGAISPFRPVGVDARSYRRQDHALTNLGRSPIVHVHAYLNCRFESGTVLPEAYRLYVGNIGVEDERHITIRTASELGKVEVSWLSAYHQERGHLRKLTFFPLDPAAASRYVEHVDFAQMELDEELDGE